MEKQISFQQEVLRKLVHLSSFWMVAAIGIFPRAWNVCLFAGLLLGIVAIEYANHKGLPLVRATYGRIFGRMLRENERGQEFRPSGAPHVLAAALMLCLLFEQRVAMTALAIMLTGDSFAAIIGRKFGRRKINHGRKSIEGAAAFWISSALVLAFFVLFFRLPTPFVLMGIFGITTAMLAEIFEEQIKIDDNFSIPLAMGLSLSLAHYL